MTQEQQDLLAKISNMIQWKDTWQNRLQSICDLIQRELDTYNWVGFYFLYAEHSILMLGPYAGKPTDHTRIPVGKGICGQAAETGETVIVQDVTLEDNYISCGLDVKSEIVVPMYHNGAMIGQIDIDSHTLAAFSEVDQKFLEEVNAIVAPHIPPTTEVFEALTSFNSR